MNFKRLSSLIVLGLTLCFSAYAQNATSPSDSLSAFTGKWVGTFEGASSGQCEMVLSPADTGKMGGVLTIIPADGNRYPIDFKSVTIQGNQLKLTYNDPSDGDEVSLEGTRESRQLKGTWRAGDGAATGTW
ncbi:MAG: hypothetical protein LH606_02195, partial [Cytophagaceae bacterium]|nr:hypothetical protein [Cytophagaceae bacterium]